MVRITEPDLILPALKVILHQPGIATSELIEELRIIFNPTGEDAEILKGRKDDKFSQIVRNLVSHHTLDVRLGYTTISAGESVEASHTISSEGEIFLENNIESLENLLSNDFDYDTTIEGIGVISKASPEEGRLVVYDENMLISEGKRRTVKSKVRNRSQRLREKAIEYFTQDGVIVCQICGFDFNKKYGDIGKGFIEIHHKKPVYHYEKSDFIKFLGDALENLSPLCSNCHRMVHRRMGGMLSIRELKKIITDKS